MPVATEPGRRPLASVSLDLDNQWAYMKTHGDPGWERLPTYLDELVPVVLERLDALGLEITFFIVGQDAALARNRAALGQITAAGHEVGNHSFHHEQWIHTRTRDQIRDEVRQAADAIERATGQPPVGYRGPGFSWNRDLLEVLAEEGALFDASTLPTYLGPLARRYYLRRSALSEKQMEQRANLFGGLGDGRRPNKPYLWELADDRTLLEIPVTTMPLARTPFHLSYLLYLSRFSRRLMSAYLDTALGLCRLTGTEPSFLLHPLDLLGPGRAPELAFFPGMDLPDGHKRDVFDSVLGRIARSFDLVVMSRHARAALARRLPRRRPEGRTRRSSGA